MTGVGTVSVINAGTIGCKSSNASYCLAIARPTRIAALVSSIVLFGRLASRTAFTLTTGIRGTAPPLLG
jgi:hypothetical protein